MRLGKRPKVTLAALVLCSCMSMSLLAPAQLHAGATVALSATLPSSISLSDQQLPVTIVVSNGTQDVSINKVTTKWNLDRRTATGFRIIGTLVGSSLPSTSLEECMASVSCRGLQANGSIVLLAKVVTSTDRQGELETPIQLRVKSVAIRNLPDGIYRGWLKLEAQVF